jgi:hypothetical protein
MAAVRCKRCGAVVSARRVNGDVETSYGADFRAKCRELADKLGADFVSTAIECSHMAKFIERAAFRIPDSDRTSCQVVPDRSTTLEEASLSAARLVSARVTGARTARFAQGRKRDERKGAP